MCRMTPGPLCSFAELHFQEDVGKLGRIENIKQEAGQAQKLSSVDRTVEDGGWRSHGGSNFLLALASEALTFLFYKMVLSLGLPSWMLF